MYPLSRRRVGGRTATSSGESEGRFELDDSARGDDDSDLGEHSETGGEGADRVDGSERELLSGLLLLLLLPLLLPPLLTGMAAFTTVTRRVLLTGTALL